MPAAVKPGRVAKRKPQAPDALYALGLKPHHFDQLLGRRKKHV